MIRKLKQKKLKNLDVLRQDFENKINVSEIGNNTTDETDTKRTKKNINLDDLNREILLKTKIKPSKGGKGYPYISTKNLIMG